MDWLDYERFVEQVCRELAEAPGITVYSKRRYEAASGREIEVDVSFELNAMGARIFGIVECKHYRRRVQAAQVFVLAQTVHALRAHKGILFSGVGFQSGAVIEARQAGIALALLQPAEAAGPKYVVRGPEEESQLLRGRIHLPDGPQAPGEDGFAFHSAGDLARLLVRYGTGGKLGRM
jgi:hypothetical protein